MVRCWVHQFRGWWGKPVLEPQFELDEYHANYAAGLQSGMRISLVCMGHGDVAKKPMSEDCVQKLTGLFNSIAYGFTHAPSMDKVTGIAQWQVAVSQGWLSISAVHSLIAQVTF